MAYQWDFEKDFIGQYKQWHETEKGFCTMNSNNHARKLPNQKALRKSKEKLTKLLRYRQYGQKGHRNMKMTLGWWERDGDQMYGKPVLKEIEGANAAECMAQVRDMRNNNDLTKNTPIEIVDVRD